METFHLLITRRRAVWRVRILFRGCIFWKSYRVAEYPTPEEALRRCAAGLVGRDKDDEHNKGHNNSYQNAIHYRMPLCIRWEYWGRLWG